MPYAYPYFDKIDPESQWLNAIDTGYDVAIETLSQPGVHLIPDFMKLDIAGAPSMLGESVPLSRKFSFDAVRIFWRVSMDCRLTRRLRACADPVRASTLVDLIRRSGKLFTEYEIDGSPASRAESLMFYAAVLPSLEDYSPASAVALRNGLLGTNNLLPILRKNDRYYDLNWIWFGLALADGLIPERTPALAEILR